MMNQEVDEVVDLSQRTDEELNALAKLRYPNGIPWSDINIIHCWIANELVRRAIMRDHLEKPWLTNNSIELKINSIERQLKDLSTIVNAIHTASAGYQTYIPQYNYSLKPDGSTY